MSAIAFKNGDIYEVSEHTDSHEHLVAALGLKDDLFLRDWIRVEFLPGENGLADASGYKLRVDEHTAPEWWEDARPSVLAKLQARIHRMIVMDKRECLLGKCWILAGKAEAKLIVSARVVAMLGSSQVGEMWDSSQVG